MADYTLADTDQGIYEIALTADTAVTIEAESPCYLTLLVHSGASPVYTQSGAEAAVKGRSATMALAGQWVDLRGAATSVAVICSSDAVVSIYRG